MRNPLRPWSSFVLLAPLVGACAAQATVTPPAVTAQVDTSATVDASGTVVGAGAPTDQYDDTDPSALTDFHQTLDSHGVWVDDPTYGTVWVPAGAEVGSDYVPYTSAGHWAYDDSGDYVWVSDYDWGWAPYHYGRWVFIDGRGWSWIPGRVYRGAWVTWGADDGYGYVGWAPMAPEYVWRGGVAVSYTYAGPPRWSYVGRGDLFSPHVGGRVLTGSAAAGISGNVHPIGVSGGGSAGGHVGGGPPLAKLGLTPTTVPHVSGAGAAGIQKAAQFGHPSTAAQLGGHPPSHVPVGTTMGGAASGGITGTSASGARTGLGAATPGTAPASTGATGHVETLPHAAPASETQVSTQTTAGQTPPGKQPPKKKVLPTPDLQPTNKGGGASGHGGGGGGGGHGGQPKPH
jgi:hypothetical protein